MNVANVMDDMISAVSIETSSTLHYLVTSNFDAVVDPAHAAAAKIFHDAWIREGALMGDLIDLVASEGGNPNLFGTFGFAPTQLNFSEPGHLLRVVPPLIVAEIARLRDILTRAPAGSRFGRLVSDIIEAKERGVAAMEAAARPAEAAADGEDLPAGTPAAASGDLEYPWRDPDMDLGDRMKEVGGDASVAMKLWAAMAQTDCTACGYDCEGYAEAIANGEEDDLSKCVPGEDATAEMLASIMGK